jgi:hypothetical protein
LITTVLGDSWVLLDLLCAWNWFGHTRIGISDQSADSFFVSVSVSDVTVGATSTPLGELPWVTDSLSAVESTFAREDFVSAISPVGIGCASRLSDESLGTEWSFGGSVTISAASTPQIFIRRIFLTIEISLVGFVAELLD